MATIPLQRAKYVKGPFEVLSYPEAASQSFVAGAFLTLNTSGQVLVAPDDAVYVIGMALQDASGTTNDAVLVLIAEESTVFEGNYTTSGSAAVTAQTIVGDEVGLELQSTGFHTIDSDGTACVKIRDLSKRDAVGDTGGRVHFTFKASVRQGDDAAADDDGV